ncbi:MAG TPA: methyltransferase domain-containing protein [Candidatus Acidoferrales bacterium]|nr:methyltransferase domain-containing protein [Candidatus Acidoferrales bacterium]
MLTLFPRIRPNPMAPPSLPLEPLPEPKPSESASELVPLSIEVPTETASAIGIETETVSANHASPVTNGVDGDKTTSISNSDVFGAFLSGMATGNPEPFIVEITAQSAAPELKEKSELPDDVSPGLPERGPELAKPITMAASEDQSAADGSLLDSTVAPAQNPEVASTFAVEGDAGTISTELVVAAANIFDELDILHEAAIASSLQGETPGALDSAHDKNSTAQPQRGTAIEAAEVVGQITVEEAPQPTVPAPIAESESIAAQEAASEMPAPISDAATIGEQMAQEPTPAAAPTHAGAEESVSEDNSAEIATQHTTAQEAPANITQATGDESASLEQAAVETPQNTAMPAAQPSNGPSEGIHTTPSARSSMPPKPKRAKGTLFGLARVPEAETMDDSGEVEAYASAAAQAHLDAIDDTFVAHAQLLLKGRERGRVLDIGTGPGQIVIKLGYRLTRWKFVGIDRSATMIEKAMESLATAGELAGRVEFRVADGNALDFPDKSFEMVVCNSVLHHIPDPQRLFAEIARVVKPGGAILLRDLRRPSRPGYGLHVWKHGKHYSKEMRQLFVASVQSAYTEEELQKMVTASPLRDVHVFRHGKSHIGFERPIAIPATSKN